MCLPEACDNNVFSFVGPRIISYRIHSSTSKVRFFFLTIRKEKESEFVKK